MNIVIDAAKCPLRSEWRIPVRRRRLSMSCRRYQKFAEMAIALVTG